MTDGNMNGANRTFDRTPPHDEAAEQGVLGGMLLSTDAIADVVEVLRGADFYLPRHAIVFDTIVRLFTDNIPTDVVTVGAELVRQDQLVRAGDLPYLHTLINSVPTAANAGYYAQIVSEKAIARRVIEAGTRIVQLGYAPSPDIDHMVDAAQAAVFDVAEQQMNQDVVRLSDLIQPTIEEIEARQKEDGKAHGVPTGFTDLDNLTNGLHPGQLIIIAARPAVGKSTLGLDFVRNSTLRHGKAAALFSLEMSRSEITTRLLSAEARVQLQRLRAGKMQDEDWDRLALQYGNLTAAPLFVDDSPYLTITEIRAKTRRLRQKNDLALIVVDYLQLLNSTKRTESRQQEVAEMSRSLKLLAKELHVPVVALSQLNRNPESRADKKPMLSDLRESGAIEQDADVIILMHREDMYEPESPRAGEADLIVAKHRNGPTGVISVAFQGHYSRFMDLAAH
jgi:replicative DNA helicase